MPVPTITPSIIAPLVAANLAQAEGREPMDRDIIRKALIGTGAVCAILAILIGGGLMVYPLWGR